MIILPKPDTERINLIIDLIVGNTGITVAEIKQKFGLTDEEYQMCSELSEVAIRWRSEASYFKTKYSWLLSEIENTVNNSKARDKPPMMRKNGEHA